METRKPTNRALRATAAVVLHIVEKAAASCGDEELTSFAAVSSNVLRGRQVIADYLLAASGVAARLLKLSDRTTLKDYPVMAVIAAHSIFKRENDVGALNRELRDLNRTARVASVTVGERRSARKHLHDLIEGELR